MRHPRWIHLVCIAAPVAAIVLLVAGVGPGLVILAWLLCPIVMLVMMRTMGHAHTRADHHTTTRSDPPPAPAVAALPDAAEEVRP